MATPMATTIQIRNPVVVRVHAGATLPITDATPSSAVSNRVSARADSAKARASPAKYAPAAARAPVTEIEARTRE
mgnify:CR=1 FL=1